MNRYRQFAITILLSLAASSCSIISSVGEPAPVEDRSSQQPAVTVEAPAQTQTEVDEIDIGNMEIDAVQTQSPGVPSEQTTESEPVVVALLDEAEQHASQGKTEQAIASLERGIRLKPKDPWLWHQLGVLRLQQGEWQKAITLAEKSNTLAGQNTVLLAGNWQIIARARQSLGDRAGAESAREMVQTYER